MEDEMGIDAELSLLSEMHRAIDRKLQEETARLSSDDMRIAQLKREKLKLKDEIAKRQSVRKH